VQSNEGPVARSEAYFISAEPYYEPLGDEVEIFEAAFRNSLPLLLKGPTGCGKTRFVEHMAWRLRRPLVTVSCHDDLTASDLVGRFLVKGGETLWVDGPLTRAVRIGGICYLDEVVEARKDATVVIHPLADDRRQLPVEKTGELLQAGAEFCLAMSYNPSYQSVSTVFWRWNSRFETPPPSRVRWPRWIPRSRHSCSISCAGLTRLATSSAKYRLYKATAVHLWAQTRFGSFRVPLDQAFARFAEAASALGRFHALERIRLDACIGRELPGLHRDMQALRAELGERGTPPGWEGISAVLAAREASAQTSLALLDRVNGTDAPPPVCYQGALSPEAVLSVMAKRIEREKALFRLALKDLAEEHAEREALILLSEALQTLGDRYAI
jgi:hypothetical protein